MNSPPFPEEPCYSLSRSSSERWEIYERLRSLGIRCHCGIYSPLTVKIDSPIDLMQLIGILRSLGSSRGELIGMLENCWRLTPGGIDR